MESTDVDSLGYSTYPGATTDSYYSDAIILSAASLPGNTALNDQANVGDQDGREGTTLAHGIVSAAPARLRVVLTIRATGLVCCTCTKMGAPGLMGFQPLLNTLLGQITARHAWARTRDQMEYMSTT